MTLGTIWVGRSGSIYLERSSARYSGHGFSPFRAFLKSVFGFTLQSRWRESGIALPFNTRNRDGW